MEWKKWDREGRKVYKICINKWVTSVGNKFNPTVDSLCVEHTLKSCEAGTFTHWLPPHLLRVLWGMVTPLPMCTAWKGAAFPGNREKSQAQKRKADTSVVERCQCSRNSSFSCRWTQKGWEEMTQIFVSLLHMAEQTLMFWNETQQTYP